MTEAAGTALAVATGLAAAGAFGIGVAVQHRQAQLAAGTGGARALGRLARQRLWLAGLALAAAGYGLQALALGYGPLALVAPVVATDLLFALPAAARWAGRPMRRRDWAGCLLAGGGVAVFLAVAAPSPGRADAPAGHWAAAFAAVAVLACAAVTAAVRSAGTARAVLLAVAAGPVFGMTAAVTLSTTRLLSRDGLSVLGRWQPWALLVLGGTGLLLSMAAFQAGPLAATLPVMDSAEPVSGVLIGALVLGERLTASPAVLAVQLAAGAAAVGGILLLGRAALDACPPRRRGGRAPSPGLHSSDMPATGPCGELRETAGGRRIMVARVAGQAGSGPGRAGRGAGR